MPGNLGVGYRPGGNAPYSITNINAASGTPLPGARWRLLDPGSTGDLATPLPAMDPGLTHSGTGPASGNPSSPFGPIDYNPVTITNPPSTPSGGGGIDPTYLIIGIVVIVGIAAFFLVKK